jgi:UDP-N-acetylmuramoylalanine--D-glutamate ligase
MTLEDWTNKRVTVVGGLGIEGQDLTRYFARHGARVTVSDMRTADRAPAAIAALEPLGVEMHLGAHLPADGINADLVAVTQGAPLTNSIVVAARQHGVPVASMASLFFDRYPGPVCGITGSSGKTTTTSLVDQIFSAAKIDHVLGGNIGKGLMALLDDAIAQRWAVVEVSHTQLQLTNRSPHVAALLRITPNHLDAFTWDEYVGLKRRIYELQTPDDIAVFNADDPVSRDLIAQAKGETLQFSVEGDHGKDGAYYAGGTIYWRRHGKTERCIDASEITLRGFHNVVNVTGATAIAAACDIGPDAVATAVRSFKAPEHRLEFVAKVDGANYYNDSIATAPERTVAALRSFDEPVVLLLGGREKHLPLEEMTGEIARHCRAVVCFGEAGPLMAEAVRTTAVPVDLVTTLPDAVDAAHGLAQDGDVVLLSPACTSFDAYDNFEMRGIQFRRLVKEIAPERPRP